jgi:protein TonB
MKEWGMDPVAWRALSVKPTPATPAEKWFSWLDYPDREKIYKNDIEVVARLDVGADGSALKCTVVNRPPKEFIPAACSTLMRNAKFNPARDAQGQPTPAPYIYQVVFAAYYL